MCIEFRDRFTRRGCRCVRPHAVALTEDFRGGRLRLEVFPYDSIGVSALQARQGARVLPVRFKTVKTSGRVRNRPALLKAGRSGCEIGDTHPEAQTRDLARRAQRHFIEMKVR